MGRWSVSISGFRNPWKRIPLAIVILLTAASAANSETWFSRIDGLVVKSNGGVQTAADGGYVVFGTAPDSEAINRAELVKLDAAGNLVWARQYIAGSGEFIDKTSDGGFVIVAGVEGGIPAPTWIAKVDAGGNPVSQTYVSLDISKMKVVGNACYLVALSDFGIGSYGVGIAKIDLSTFAIEWSQGFLRDGGDIFPRGVGAAPNGGLYITGSTASAGSHLDAFVLQVNSAGAVDAFSRLDYPGEADAWTNGIAATPDGGIVLAGNRRLLTGPDNKHDVWVVKLRSNLQLDWQKSFGNIDVDWCNGVSILGSGDVLVGAATRSWSPNNNYDIWAIRLDHRNGMTRRQARYWTTEADETYAQVSTPDGGALLAGFHTRFAALDGTVLAKVDANGDIAAQDSDGPIMCPCVTDTNVNASNTSAIIQNENYLAVAFDPVLVAPIPPVTPVDSGPNYDRICYQDPAP